MLFQNKVKKNLSYIYLTREELSNPRMKEIVKQLITQKFVMQKYNDFIKVSILEFHMIENIFKGEFVPKEKYNNVTIWKGEIGKIRGKKLIVVEE